MKTSARGPICRGPICIFAVCILLLVACESKPLPVPIQRPAADGFCKLNDEMLQRYVVAINVLGESSSSGVATLIGHKVYIITNRHNLPVEPKLENIKFRNHLYQYSAATAVVTMGRDYADEGGLGPARDYAVLAVETPSIFAPLPLHPGRHQGSVVVPSYASRLYEVGRGVQWFTDNRFDRLDFSLAKGASGAPVISCRGEVVGLYTALIRPEDYNRTGFKGISTPILVVVRDLTGN